jgi:hypothetical protein
MDLAKLPWKPVKFETEQVEKHKQRAEVAATTHHPLPKFVAITSKEEYNIAIESDELKELAKLMGGTIDTSNKYYNSRNIIKITVSEVRVRPYIRPGETEPGKYKWESGILINPNGNLYQYTKHEDD